VNIETVKALIASAVDKDRGAPRTHDDARDARDDRFEFEKRKALALEFVVELEAKANKPTAFVHLAAALRTVRFFLNEWTARDLEAFVRGLEGDRELIREAGVARKHLKCRANEEQMAAVWRTERALFKRAEELAGVK
jgi:hypothetical protein